MYYRLTQQVKPEHIDRVTFSEKEQDQWLFDYQAISRKVDAIHTALAPEYRDAFFELVLYPVQCADLMNQKQVYALRGDAGKAVAAYDGIMELTRIYNQELAGGKWGGMMDAKPRNTKVFHKPDVEKISQANANEPPLHELKLDQAQCRGAMVLTKDGILAGNPDIQQENTDTTARFVFTGKKAVKADLYFLARCPDDKHDSWFVSFNGEKTVSNDQPTGTGFKWLKILAGELQKGRNELIISQREPGTMIRQVLFMPSGSVLSDPVADPDFVFAASDYSAVQNTTTSRWKKIDGLGIESSAMTLLPYESPSIEENTLSNAPSISYTFKSNAEQCSVEARFLPTHRIHEGMGLRYAVSVDGDSAVIRDINAPEWSGIWSSNVLNGYAKGLTQHQLTHAPRHTITLYLLDPGMVLSQVRVFTAE